MQVETKKYEELVPSTLNFKTTSGTIEPSKLWVSLSTAAAIIDDVDDNDVNLEPRPSFYPQGDGHVIVIGREGDKPFLYLLNPLAPQSNTFYCSANWRDIVYCSSNKIVIVDNEPSHSEIWSYTGHPESPFTRDKKNVTDYAYFYHSQVLARNRHARILKPFNTAIAEKIPPSKGEEGAPQKTSYVVNSVTGKDIYKFPAKWRALGEESPDGYAANHAGLIPLAVQKVGGGGDAKYLAWYSNAERKLIKRKVDTVNTVRVEKMENCRVHGPSFSFSVEREYQIDANKSKGQVFLVASAITGQIKKSAANKETILPQIENAPSQTYYPAPDNMMVFNNTQSSVFQYAKLGTDFKWSSFAYSKKFFYSFEPLNANYVWTMYKDDTKLVLIDAKSGAIAYSDFRVLSVQDHINQGWAQRFTLGKDCFGYVTQGEANIHRKYLLLHIFKIEKDNTIRRAHLLEYPVDSTIVASHNTLFNVQVCKEGGVKVKRIHVEGPSNFHTDNFTLLADGKGRSLTHVYIISPEALLLHFKLKDSNNFEWVVAHLGKDSKDVKIEDGKQFADFNIIGSSNGYICSTKKGDSKNLHVWSLKDGKTTTVDFAGEGTPELQSVTFIEGYPHIGAVCVKRGNEQEIVLHDFQANKQVAKISTGTVSFKAIKHVPERGFLLCSGFEFFTLLNLGKVLP